MAGVVLSTILDRVRTELDDTRAQRFDDQYITLYFDQANEDLIVEFAALGIDYGEQVLVIDDVTPGTVNLDSLMGNEGVLAFMILPVSLEWKHLGDPDTMYRPIPRVDKVSDTIGIDGIVNYEFRAQQSIVLALSTTDVTLRMRFMGMPSSSLNDSSNTITRAYANIFVYKVSQKIASRNGANGPGQLAEALKSDLHDAKESLQELLTKQDQATKRRFGRYNKPNSGSLMFQIPIL
jgi:hypothetical protein